MANSTNDAAVPSRTTAEPPKLRLRNAMEVLIAEWRARATDLKSEADRFDASHFERAITSAIRLKHADSVERCANELETILASLAASSVTRPLTDIEAAQLEGAIRVAGDEGELIAMWLDDTGYSNLAAGVRAGEYCDDAAEARAERGESASSVTRAPQEDQTLEQRVADYLGNGGLFNPEMMDHDKVRDLILDLRTALAASSVPPPGEGEKQNK